MFSFLILSNLLNIGKNCCELRSEKREVLLVSFSDFAHFVFAIIDAPEFPDVWSQVEPLIEGLPLVAHNCQFDESCLRAVFEKYVMDYPEYEFYCTCRASRRKLKGVLPNHQLHTVAAYCGYDLTKHHNALADAEACAAIALELL